MRSWLSRVDQLKQRLEQNPSARIPEFQFLTEQDWLGAAKNKLETDADFRTALSQLRYSAENLVAHRLGAAVKQYSESHGGQFTTDISQLKPYLKPPVDDSILQRYEILPGDSLPSVPLPAIGEWVITQKSAMDPEYDSRIAVGPFGSGSASFEESEVLKALTPAINAYLAANSGQLPEDPAKLVSYVRTPAEQAALQKAIKEFNGLSIEERTAALKKLLRSIK
jgi:hypothetical protein